MKLSMHNSFINPFCITFLVYYQHFTIHIYSAIGKENSGAIYFLSET